MKIGVAGVGRMGLMHATNLGSLDEVDRVLLFDPLADRSAEVAAPVGSKASAIARLDTLISESDGIVVASPTSTHPEVVGRAVEAGTPTLCEKPLAATSAETVRVAAKAEAADVPVMVGFHRRFDPATREARRRLRSGEAGSVYLVRAVCQYPEMPPPESVTAAGGLVTDTLIHDLDAVPWLMRESVVEVYASGSVLVDSTFAEKDDWDNVVATLRFASGAHAVLAAGRHDPVGYDCRTEVFTSTDTLAIGTDAHTPVNSLEPGGPTASPNAYSSFEDRYRTAYLNEIRAFVDIVAHRDGNPSPPRESAYSMRLAQACEESIRANAPVRIDG